MVVRAYHTSWGPGEEARFPVITMLAYAVAAEDKKTLCFKLVVWCVRTLEVLTMSVQAVDQKLQVSGYAAHTGDAFFRRPQRRSPSYGIQSGDEFRALFRIRGFTDLGWGDDPVASGKRLDES